jgi:hypothetical protein
MKTETIQTSFVGGEFAPALLGRTDIAQYANACTTVENFLIRPNGAAKSTPGTEYISDSKYTTTIDAADELDTDVVLLLQFEEANGSYNFTDSSLANHVVVADAVSGANTVLNNAKVGNGCLYITGGPPNFTGSYLNITTVSNEFNFVTDKTIEAYFRVDNRPDVNSQFSLFHRGGTYPGLTQTLYFGINQTPSGENSKLFYYGHDGANNTTTTSSTFTIDLSRWYHAALTYDSADGRVKLYLDKELIANEINTTSISSTGGTSTVGYAGSVRFGGRIDRVKITKRILSVDEFEANIINTYGKSKLNQFIFSRTDAYVIETGENYFRFYTNGGQVTT